MRRGSDVSLSELNEKIRRAAGITGIGLKEVRVHSSDVFYAADNVDDFREIYRKHQCQCVEMESFALFHNANVSGKKPHVCLQSQIPL